MSTTMIAHRGRVRGARVTVGLTGLGLALTLLLASCGGALDLGSDLSSVPEPGTGTLLVSLPAISPRLAAAVAEAAGGGARALGSRAFLFATRAELELRDSEGFVVDAWSVCALLELTQNSTVDTSRQVPVGSGYVLSARVFNDKVSASEPILAGSMSAIAIAEASTTRVSLTCVPNPAFTTALVSGTPATGSLAKAPISGSFLTDTGGEAWFSIPAQAGTSCIKVTASNPNGAGVFAYLCLYNEDGTWTGFSATSQSGQEAVIGAPLAAAKDYVLGLSYVGADSTAATYSLEIERSNASLASAGTWYSSTINNGSKMVLSDTALLECEPVSSTVRSTGELVYYDNSQGFFINHLLTGPRAGQYMKIAWLGDPLTDIVFSNFFYDSFQEALEDSAPTFTMPLYSGPYVPLEMVGGTIAGLGMPDSSYHFTVLAIPTPAADGSHETVGKAVFLGVPVAGGASTIAPRSMPGTYTEGSEYVFAIWLDLDRDGAPDPDEPCSASSAGYYSPGWFDTCDWSEWSVGDWGRPRNLKAVVSDSSVSLSWVSAAVGDPATDYEMEVSIDGGSTWELLPNTWSSSENAAFYSYDMRDGVTPAICYYRVRYNNGTVQSGWSEVATVDYL